MGLRDLDRLTRSLRDELAGLEVPQDLADRFGPYRDDPVRFVHEVLAAEPEPYQVNILDAAVTDPRIAWRAAHGVGKTATLGWIVLWWLLSRPFSRVLILAPAYERQVGRYLLPEVKKWARNAPEPLPIVVRARSVEVEGHGREWFALAVQASDATMVEGGHARSLCVLADEAKGLSAEVVAALHGTQTDVEGDRLYLLASTPGGPSGPFYDVFRRGSDLWRRFHTSALDSALVSPQWIEERRQEWGEGSPLFLARVLGEFPEEADGTLFRLSDLEAAVGRTIVHGEDEEEEPGVTLGVDPARFGQDRTAVAVWRGRALVEVHTRQGLDTMQVAAWVASLINRLHARRVCVDPIGLGAGVLDRLRQMELPAEPLNASERSDRPDRYVNRRAEAYWRFREGLERGEVSLPDDDALLSELSAIRYGFDGRGRIQIEAKDDIRKRIGRSPDRADACVIGFAAAASAQVGRLAYVGGNIVDLRTGEVLERSPFVNPWEQEEEGWQRLGTIERPDTFNKGV